MGQSEGEKELGKTTHPGPLPEGGAVPVRAPARAAPREGVQAFQVQSEPTTNLSLLADQDEPLELVIELHRIAVERSTQEHKASAASWELIEDALDELIGDLTAANEPDR